MAITHLSTVDPTHTAPSKRRGRPPKQAAPQLDAPSCLHHLDEKTRRVIDRAAKLLEESAVYRTEAMNSPRSVRAYLTLKIAALDREEFHAIWLDSQNRIIAFERMSTGSLTKVSIHPREFVKSALAHNAGAVILAHNHPSGENNPSAADIEATETLKKALAMVDVKVLDHFIVAGTSTPLSLAERGLI